MGTISRSLVQRVISLIDALSVAGGYCAAIITIGITLLTFFSVFVRYFMDAPFQYAEELLSYFLVATVFLGYAYTLKIGGHVYVDVVVTKLKPRIRKIMVRVTVFLGLVWAIELLVGVWLIWSGFFSGDVKSFGLLEAPLWIPAVVLVVGSAMLLLQLVAEIIRSNQTS